MSSSSHQVAFGGDASHIKVGQIGYGLMGLTWKDSSAIADDETNFKAMKAAVDAGATFWNTGSFYNPQDLPYANLKLIRRFFEKYPEYMDKITISVKSGVDVEAYLEKGFAGMKPDSSVEALEKDLKGIRAALNSDNGGHEVDLFESARVDLSRQPEEWMVNLMEIKKRGLFKHISLSEVGPSTIRKAAAVGPIAAVEVEYSVMELSVETNGVLAACKELNIPIVAYSPIGRGILTGGVEIAKGDPRAHQEQFSADNLNHNTGVGELIRSLAEKKGCAAAQLALAWLVHQWPEGIIPIPGSSKPDRAKDNSTAATVVTLTKNDSKAIREAVQGHGIKGGRYSAAARANLFADQ